MDPIEDLITAELSTLRMVRPDMPPDEAVRATAKTHMRINDLLNQWEDQHSHVKPKPRVKPTTATAT
jgi:uncharacterized protein (DUF2267 family)